MAAIKTINMLTVRLVETIYLKINKIVLMVFFTMCMVPVVLAIDQNIGLYIYSDNEDIPIAVSTTTISPLKISKDGIVYSIQLVDVNNPLATKMRTRLPSGAILAWKRFYLGCSSDTVVIINSTSSPKKPLYCPAGYAAFAIDDTTFGSRDSISLACCPLPSPDILKGVATRRSNECSSNEVATGCQANGGKYDAADFICTSIDTSKYKLDDSKQTCYLGSGIAGQGTAEGCKVPPTAVNALVDREPFGSDVCVGFPYGGLIVSKDGKNCNNMKSRVLRYKTGKAVEMFPPE